MTNPSNQTILHGNALVLDGKGILLTGASGIGKTYLSSQLISAGCHIIADDAVALCLEGDTLYAAAPKTTYNLIAYNLHTIASITNSFGEQSLVDQSSIDMRIHLYRQPEIAQQHSLLATLPTFYLHQKVCAPSFIKVLIKNKLDNRTTDAKTNPHTH